ncbi:MAG TPA: type II secretion system F family protein, partial [Oxalicibacterium sp.]|nr:type II secretion system F family protein [Oxalicibacterium sp.]
RATIAAAGVRSGLFTELEGALIHAATEAGSPAAVYRRLADYYAQRARQAKAVRARLAWPAFTLVASLFIQPLPALLRGELSGGAYLLHSVGVLLALLMTLPLIRSLPDRLHRAPRTSMRTRVETLYLKLPLFGDMHLRRNLCDFVESLALLVEAGMPVLEALPIAVGTMQNGVVRAAFMPVRRAIERGASLTAALENVALMDNAGIALIHTGESSGTLPAMLFHYAEAETDAINRFEQALSVWAPRLVYAAVSAWMAYSILRGAAITTPV